MLGIVERGGQIRVLHLPDRGGAGIKAAISEHVLPSSMIFTDEWPVYKASTRPTGAIGASATRNASTWTATRTPRPSRASSAGIRGVYHAVSAKWLQSYLNEYAWRYNRRHDSEPMFAQLLARAAQ